MKKLIYLFLTVLITLSVSAQDINKTNDGYTEVVDVELTKKEIHQKINEWIAVNYKSANDVIQLNTEDKVIAKGNFLVNLIGGKYTFTYRINNTLSFSIRDNKYKIDLIPTGGTTATTGVSSGVDFGTDLFSYYITQKNLSKEEFSIVSVEASIKGLLAAGYSEKKSKKMTNNYVVKKIDDLYEVYLKNKLVWDNDIKSTFQSIKDYVIKSNNDNDDW
jgi:hypothetical protein